MMSKSNMAETNMAEIPIWRDTTWLTFYETKEILTISYSDTYQPLRCNFIKQQLTSYGSLSD